MVKANNQIWTQAERDAWMPPPDITVSQWADRNRIIGNYSAEPGPWRTDRAPYLRDIMDAYTDSQVEEITIVGPAQCGKSEVVFNMLGYTVDVDPVPTMYVIARDEDCEDISGERLKPMFEDAPSLAKHLTGNQHDMKKGRVFKFDRMPLYFNGSNSAAGLSSKPIGRLFLDETDKYKDHVGAEGSPAALAIRRTTTFPDFKIVKLCTLTTKNGYIYQSYHRSNMQTEYVPCPRCGIYFIPAFSQLKVDLPDCRDPEIIIETECVHLDCPNCGGRIEPYEKTAMVDAVVWCPKGQTVDENGRLTGKANRGTRHVGFWINCMTSPWLHWHRMLAEWFSVNTPEGIAKGTLREFKNQVLGQPWEEIGKKVKTSDLRKQVAGFSAATVPDWVLLLTASADYHKSKKRGVVRIDFEVRGFGYKGRNAVILTGSVTSFDELDKAVLLSSFPWADGVPNEKKPWLAVMLMFVDSGYEADDVYGYCRKRPGFTIPTKGKERSQLRPIRLSDLEQATERRLKRKSKKYKGMQLAIIDTNFFKDQVTRWVEPVRDEDGNIVSEALTEFYAEIPDHYFQEFTAEHRVEVFTSGGSRSKWVWKPVTVGAETHSLDLAVLNAAAAYYKGVHYLRPKGQKKTLPAAARKRKVKLSELQRRKRLR